MAKITLEMPARSSELNLNLTDYQISRLEDQISILKNGDVDFTPRAMLFMVLAIDSISSEPSRDWPDFLEKDSKDAEYLKNRFIDAFGYHFLTLAQGLQDEPPGRKIE